MKNSTIISLANRGILEISTKQLSAESAYKVFRFRKFISSSMDQIGEEEQGLLKEVGIDDAKEFDKERVALLDKQRTPDEEKRLTEMDYAILHYAQLRECLMKEERVYEGSRISYADFKALQDSNDSQALSGMAELLLENELWVDE